MPIYEAPSVFVTSPVFDPKKQDSSYSKLFQSEDTVTYNQTTETMGNDHYSAKQDTTKKTEADSESCWGMFKSREHFNAMHFS